MEKSDHPELVNFLELNDATKSAVDNLAISCICLNGRNDILYYNKKAALFFGFGEGQEKFSSFSQFSPFRQPDGTLSAEKAEEWIEETFQKGYAKFSWMHQDMNGEQLPALVELQKVNFDGGDCVLAYIREDQRAERYVEELHATSSHMQAVIDAAPTSVTLWDESLSIIDCNMETLKLFDVSSKKEYFDNFMSLSPEFQPDGRRSIDAFFNLTSEALEKSRITREWVHQTLKGELIPAEVTIAWTTVNQSLKMTSYVKDLREQYSYISKLQEADERTHIMLDSMPLACDFWDENLNMIDCNQAALDLFEIDNREEYCEKFNMLSPEIQPCGRPSSEVAEERVREAIEKGIVEFEWMHQRLNGELIPAEVTLVRVNRNDSFNVLGYIRDISKLKETMQALVSAKEAAEAANISKSNFLSNMSHEIRTPMNAIIGMADLLMAESLTEQQQKYVNDVKTSSTSLLGIINDILDFSKIEAGKLELLPVSFDIKELLSNLESMFAITAEKKGIDFYMEIEEALPWCIFGDDIRIRQVLINTIGNAIKFTPAGYVKLFVGRENDMIRFDIADTGIGIKQEDLPRLFDDFEQLDSSNNRKIGGSGLGLSISRNLVRMMEGNISVESIYGKGTIFHVRIPLIPGNESEAAKAAAQEPFISAPEAKILVVDDNEMNLAVASGLLKSFDIQCETVLSGREAIAKVLQTEYDIVFMDHMMPEMDGVETTNRIRESGEEGKRLTIIALTANAIGGVKETLISAGMNDYLSKPIDKALLNKMLIKWLPPERIQGKQQMKGWNEMIRPNAEMIVQLRENVLELDVSLALNRIGGMWDVYEKSLYILERRLLEVCGRLETFLAEEDIPGFAIEVHGAKGSLNNIGATNLAKLAEELEFAAKRGDEAFCIQHLPKLVELLKALHAKLSPILQGEETAGRKDVGSLEELLQELPKVKAFLDQFEGDEAMEILKEVKSRTYGAEVDMLLESILRMTEEFDYDGAIHAIDSL